MMPLLLPRHADRPPRVLCLGAHADDIEIGCGGTLLQLLRERPETQVVWVVFSAEGERESEARAGAERFLAGAADRQVHVMKLRDGHFPAQWAEAKAIFEGLKHQVASPDLIFTHYREDRHQDHRTVSDLTWNTWRRHLVLEYEVPKYDGDMGRPNAYMPIPRSVGAQKIEQLIEVYNSQRTRSWMSPDTFEGLMRLRGIECAAPEGWAEAFHARKFVFGA